MKTRGTTRFAVPVFSGLIFLSFAAGCASTPPTETTQAPQSQPAPASGPARIEASAIYRPAPWKKTYSEGRRVIRREASPVDGAANRWMIEEFDSPDGKLKGGLVRQTMLELGPDGSVFLTELRLVAEDRVLMFDPPLVLMPAVLTSEKACISTSDVTMREVDGTTTTRGTATQTTTLVSQSGDRTVVKSELVAKFDFSTVDRTAVFEVVAGRGIVKEVQDRAVRFGLFNLSRKTSTATLIEQPAE